MNLPTASPDSEESAVQARDGVGVHAFVVSAYEAHHGEIFAFLARATRSGSVAADALQETYRRLTKEARDGHVPQQVRGWLFRVATYLAIEGFGRKATAGRWLGRNGQKEHEGVLQSSPELDRVLEGLSTDARVALLLSGEGFTGEEIAAAMGRSAAATRTLLGRARARVRLRRDLFGDEAR